MFLSIFLIGLLLLWIIFRMVAKSVIKPASQMRRDGLQCGQCRYNVRGISSTTCPECGADLREVGILPPGSARRTSAGIQFWFWSLLILASGWVVTNMLVHYALPRQAIDSLELRLHSDYGTIRTVQLNGQSNHYIWPGRTHVPPNLNHRLFCQITLNTGETLQAEMYQQRLRLISPKTLTTQASDIDRPLIDEWLRHVGHDPDEAALQGQVLTILQHVYGFPPHAQAQASAPSLTIQQNVNAPFSYMRQDISRSIQTPPWMIAFIILLWLLVWAWGVIKLVFADEHAPSKPKAQLRSTT